MSKQYKKTWLRSFLITVFFNTLIALFITSMDFGGDLFENLIFSQCIGLSILSVVKYILIRFHAASSVKLSILVVAAMLPAIVVGTTLAVIMTGNDISAFIHSYDILIRTLVMSLVFGFVITFFFISKDKIADAESQAREEKIQRLISEKNTAEAKVKQLQAQIEPHFLFNTLSNILSLLDAEPQKGKTMLEDFIRYLRISLTKIREDLTTLGIEMKMIQAYLDLHKVRMGKRLTFHIDLPEDLSGFHLPPMLLQPLVENALKHGLEPKIEGGELAILASQANGLVRIEVHDTGLGFAPGGKTGLGITNIRERLNNLYNGQAGLVLKSPDSGGVRAILEVPDDSHTSSHSRR